MYEVNKKNIKEQQRSFGTKILGYIGTAKVGYIISAVCSIVEVLCGVLLYLSAAFIKYVLMFFGYIKTRNCDQRSKYEEL